MGYLDDLINKSQHSNDQYMYDLNHASDPASMYTGQPIPKAKEPITIDSELAKANMSPEDKQNILEAYKNQFGQLPGVDKNYGNTPEPQRQIASAPEQMGPPKPTLDQARNSTPSQASTSPVSDLMGKLNAPSQERGPTLQDILSKLNGQNDSALKEAQDKRDKMQNLSMLGKSANMILGGQTHTTPSNAVWDEMSKNAGQGIDDIKNKSALLSQNLTQNEQARKLSDEEVKSDPKSPVSIMATQIAKKMLPDLNVQEGKTSASDLEKINPMLVSYASHMLALESKKDSKKEEQILKYSKAMGEDLDPSRGRSGNQGKLQQVISDSKAIDALTANYSNLNAVPPAQYAEMVSSLDRLVSRGNPAIERFRHLMPANSALSAAGMIQWIKSEPAGANQKAFIQNILNTSKAERDVAAKQILDNQFKKANSTHQGLKSLSPDHWYNNLSNATGLSIDEIKHMEGQEGYKGTPTANALEQTKQSSSEVRVQLPDGRIGSIPKENLEDALKHGAKKL